MKKSSIYKILYFISILLFIGYIIRLITDYQHYNPIITSAPFYTYIIIRSVEYLLPCIIVFIIAIIIKKNRKINK